jgi:hypothetical protein
MPGKLGAPCPTGADRLFWVETKRMIKTLQDKNVQGTAIHLNRF